jgi:Family of unknown function (DUF6141)
MPLKRTPGTNEFREVQHFNQWWAWAVIAGLAATGWWAFIEQIVLGHPWGNNPAPGWVVVLMWLIFGIGVPIGMRWVRLIVRVTEDTLDIRYVPFRHRVIPLSTITSAEPRRYRPIRDFMGWGIRWMPGRGWVYSVAGDEGVQLVLGKRRKLLVGSHKPVELAAAITAGWSPDGDSQGAWDESDAVSQGGEESSNGEPLFETPAYEECHEPGSQRLGNLSAKVRAGVRRAQRALFPAIGRAVGWVQAIARRLGESERVQRFADDPGSQAAEAAKRVARVGKEVGAKAAKVGSGAGVRAGMRAGNTVAHRFREIHVPTRVAQPARRYMRNPQLIVDDFKKTG